MKTFFNFILDFFYFLSKGQTIKKSIENSKTVNYYE